MEEEEIPKVLYMMVTNDKYELPLAVADTQAELARLTGARPGSVWAGIRRRFRGRFSIYVEVPLE